MDTAELHSNEKRFKDATPMIMVVATPWKMKETWGWKEAGQG
jgi:hypothetical protein